jgi:dTDP-4-amino-4,6-dideoxy-D-galactose acyltransferase
MARGELDSARICHFLDWDSDFFGVRVARLVPRRLNPSEMKRAMVWCRNHRIDCLYFLADAADLQTIRLSEKYRFRSVDIRMTLERELKEPDFLKPLYGAKLRLSSEQDIPALESIAKTAHQDSRFYYDPHFKTARCSALYQTWIRYSCRDFADAVWVAEIDRKPVGYVSCHLKGQNRGEIGLVGLAQSAQGKGLGQGLILESLRWFFRQGVRQVSVVTQGRNIRAQRLYQRCGFLTCSVDLWYHYWFHDS